MKTARRGGFDLGGIPLPPRSDWNEALCFYQWMVLADVALIS